jgi:hypothetical protein
MGINGQPFGLLQKSHKKTLDLQGFLGVTKVLILQKL